NPGCAALRCAALRCAALLGTAVHAGSFYAPSYTGGDGGGRAFNDISRVPAHRR
ncbi:MAG: hypothetical protein ACI8S6_005304, partial [Myxococcota bacterium]